MKIAAIIAACLTAAPASAEVVLSDCRVELFALESALRARCEMTNQGEAAIDRVFYDMDLREHGRAHPWYSVDGWDVRVSGGLEPGETVTVTLGMPFAPDDRMDMDSLWADVTLLEPDR